jgi:hypothetical protein
VRPDGKDSRKLAPCSGKKPLFAGISHFDAVTVRASEAFSSLEMVNDEAWKPLEAILRSSVDQLRPTASFRRRAWREFQRALDPLGPFKPLPRVHD